jgi:hypothetical protein
MLLFRMEDGEGTVKASVKFKDKAKVGAKGAIRPLPLPEPELEKIKSKELALRKDWFRCTSLGLARVNVRGTRRTRNSKMRRHG